MLVQPIVLDASMTASEVMRRLARNGLWLDPLQSEAAAWINETAALINITPEDAARRLARPVEGAMAVIRRQWFANVLWYIRPIDQVLDRCQSVPPGMTLLDALNLHESDSTLPIPPPEPGTTPMEEGVILRGDMPVAVSVNPEQAPSLSLPAWKDMDLGPTRSATGYRPTEVSERVVQQTWPRIDAPEYWPARKPFSVVVGFSRERQRQVFAAGPVTLSAPAGQEEVQITVELTASGVDAPEGWTRRLLTPLADPTSVSVSFTLVALDPPGPEPFHLTMLEVRYLLENGEVCGTASKPLVIGQSNQADLAGPVFTGAHWLAQPSTGSEVNLTVSAEPPDLTIELMKPDGNPARGYYVCRLRSPHPIKASGGPFTIDVGEETKTFARTIVDRVRMYGSTPLVDNCFRSLGREVSDKLPQSVHDALQEVAAITKPRTPTVLFVSAEPYVPWELAWIDPPLDPNRPPYLGAQVALGRWLRDKPSDAESLSVGTGRIEKPPVVPPSEIPVRQMAVIAGVYQAASGFRSLPEAKVEAETLTTTYDAIPLAASAQSISQLLDARLEHNFQQVGGADAVHFAGHGEYEPGRPDASVLFLSDGMPLSADLFRGASYGGAQQPLAFFNACMIGIGGEVLGDMGGFPGNCLKGGFGGVLGALWEVNDTVARMIALEFWERVMPADGSAGEPIAEVLRDIRARYAPPSSSQRVPTYLAYVYYGHPRLKLRRILDD